MHTLGNTGFGGEVFLVSALQDFPVNACSFSLWTHQETHLFYGYYDTGSSYDSTETFLDLDFQSGGLYLNFAGNSFTFAGGAFPPLRPGESHHLAITFSITPDGYALSYYVNAVLVVAETIKILNGNNQPMRLLPSGPLYIGNRAPDRSQDGQFGNLQEARGAMSELHIYREAMTPEAVNLDALGEVPDNVTPYLNLPLDDLHYDRRRGLWLDTVRPYYNAQEFVRTDNNPQIIYDPYFSRFPTADRSVAFWIRCREDAKGVLISYGDVTNSDHPNEGGSQWVLEDPSSLRLGSYGSGLQLGTGNWNHVAVVEDTAARTTTVYLNGQPGPNPPANYVIEDVLPNQPLVLGAQRATNANDSVFNGELVELRIWSRPLMPNEVAEFARGLVPDPADPALVDYQPLGSNGARGGLDASGRIFLPILNNEVKYPLLSGQATMHALRVGPDKGGMQTLAYTNLSAVEISLELWAQMNTDGYLVRGLGANNQVNFSLARQGNEIILLISDRSKGPSHRFIINAEGKALNEWHHLAITIASTAVNAYLDGQEAFAVPISDPNSFPALGDQLRLQFGSLVGAVLALDGGFAEIRFWNRALNVGEIRHRMYHFLVGNEFGLAGRWAFENGLGRDTSSSQRHAFPVDKPEFTLLTDIDLEAVGSPYLVAQVSLMEDYHFDESTITNRNSYRVNVTAFDESDLPLTGIDLSVSIQAEPGNPFQNADLLIEDSGKTESHPIAIGQPYVLTTNSRGGISFALPAEDLLAPVLRITAPFMAQDHALLIFPDRQAHHQLSQVTEEALLNKKVVMEPGGEPVAMVSDIYRDSAPHLAKAIRNFMGVATEKIPQSNNPVVRPVEDRLREVVTPPDKRRYENATASPDAYNPTTDVISGYAVAAGQTSISRSLSVNQLPDWQFSKNEAGTFVVEAPPASRTRNLSQTDNLQYANDFTRMLLQSVDGRQRSVPPASYADLIAAIDQSNRTRDLFNLFTAIRDALSFVVETVEHVYESVKETIRVAVVYITQASNQILAFAIHAVEHAVEAVKGVLAKVGATVVGAINFVKEIFDWSDILETQAFTEQLLKSAMAATRANLSTSKTSTMNWVEGLKSQTHDWLEQLKSNAAQNKSSIKDEAVPGQRTNVKGSYVQNLVGTHGKDASLEGSDGGPDPSQAQEKLDKIHNDNAAKVSQINGALTNLQLFSGTEFSMRVIVDRLIDLLEAIADSLFDLMKAGLDWFFDQLEILLADLDQLLAYRINLPLVTRLYEEVITNGSQLTLYSLSALLGAIPTTITYKLATGSDHGPFHGEELSRYRDVFVTTQVNTSVDQAQREELQARQQKASLGLGGCFLVFIAITGVFNTNLNTYEIAPIKLKRIGFALNGIFQLTQFPLGSTFTLQTNPNAPSAATEEAIWVAQFFPLVLEGISASDKLNANQPAYNKFSGISTTVFGGLHAVLFITVFALEITNPNSDKEDSGMKFAANLVSCVPELTAMVPQPVVKAVLSALASTAWELMSLVRYANEVKVHHNFLAR